MKPSIRLSIIRLITFDIFDTILVPTKELGKVYKEAAQKYGVTVESNLVDSHFSLEFAKLDREYPHYGRWNNMKSIEWWKILISRTFHAVDLSIPEDKIDNIGSELIHIYQSGKVYNLMPGTRILLDFLHTQKLKIGVISNYDDSLGNVLAINNIKKDFHFTVSSYETGFCKPDIAMFNIAKDKAKLDQLLSSECIHVGNSYAKDYVGSLKANWRPILIRYTDKATFFERHPEIPKDAVYANMKELYDKFVELSK